MSIFQLFRLLALLSHLVFAAAAFANKKKPSSSKKHKKSASNNKGFGRAPETLDQVVAAFPTRLPESNSVPCPCQSACTNSTAPVLSYKDCCEPFHLGHTSCQTPERVLRSRYSAFCYRIVPYIISTTHSSSRDYQTDTIAWAKSLHKDGMIDSFLFQKLSILASRQEREDEAFIDFTVALQARDGIFKLAGKTTVISETSKFVRDVTGVWTYASGKVSSSIPGLEGARLNR
jgi:SEC-C motif-containing protein